MVARTAFVVALALIAAVLSADDQPSKPKSDREALVGTWKIVGYQDDGAERLSRLGAVAGKKGEPARMPKLVFTTDECYVLSGSGNRFVSAGHTGCDFKVFTLREDASPKQIDIESCAGKKGETLFYFGVYELDGDKLKISYNESPSSPEKPGKRPDRFVSNRDMNLIICEKVSDTPEKPK